MAGRWGQALDERIRVQRPRLRSELLCAAEIGTSLQASGERSGFVAWFEL